MFAEKIREISLALAAKTDRPKDGKGIALTPLHRTIDETGIHYDRVDVAIDSDARTITITQSNARPQHLVAAGDELYLADSTTNQIHVYPTTGSGSLAPTRLIGTDTLQDPWGIAVY